MVASADNSNNLPGAARRRITLRRSNYGGGGLASSTTSRGFNGHNDDEHDEVDQAIDPEQAAERLDQNVRRGPITIDGDTFDPDPSLPQPRNDPRARMNEVALAGSSNYAKEYRLTLLHRLLMRRVPLDQIARQLNVSISTIEKDRIALKQRLRELAKEQDINEIIGANNEIYAEIRGMAMRVASAGEGQRDAEGRPIAGTPVAMKLAAMRTALAATNDNNRMLSAAGVFDALRFRRAETADGQTDMQRLMQGGDDLIRQLLEEDDDEDGGEASTPAPAKRVVRRKPRAGFAPLTFEDNDSDTAAQEHVEL